MYDATYEHTLNLTHDLQRMVSLISVPVTAAIGYLFLVQARYDSGRRRLEKVMVYGRVLRPMVAKLLICS